MNLKQIRAKAGIVFATLIALTAVTAPVLAPDTLGDLIGFTHIITAIAAGFAVYAAITPARRNIRDASTILAAALLLDAAAYITADPQNPVLAVGASLAFGTLLAATARFLVAISHNAIRVFLALTLLTWVASISLSTDPASITFGLIALAAPGLTIHALNERSARTAGAAFAAWIGATLYVLRLAALVEARYVSESSARNALLNMPAFNSPESIPDLVAVNTTPVLIAAAITFVLGASALLFTRFAKMRRLGVIAALIGAMVTSTGVTIANAELPPAAAASQLETTYQSSGMLSDAGAGPKDRYRNQSFEQCDSSDNRDCFITYFDNIALEQGVVPAVKMIVDLVKRDIGATFPGHCHQVVHNLGQMAMDLSGGDFDAVKDIDPQVCGTGFTHGLWELNFNRMGVGTMFSKTGVVCDELGMVNDWYRWTCSHILGHMMMTESMEDPAVAMEYCLKIEHLTHRADCLAGGWMNYFQDDYILDFFRSGKGSAQDLFNICYGAKLGQVKILCYQELFPVIYAITDGDDIAAGKMCVELAEPQAGVGNPWDSDSLNFADRCVQGLARAVAVSSRYDYRVIPQRCNSMPAQVRGSCLASAAASIVLNTGSQTGGLKVCETSKDELYRAYCAFWVKNSQRILSQGPNASKDLPRDGEVRLPGLGNGIAGTEDETASKP